MQPWQRHKQPTHLLQRRKQATHLLQAYYCVAQSLVLGLGRMALHHKRHQLLNGVKVLIDDSVVVCFPQLLKQCDWVNVQMPVAAAMWCSRRAERPWHGLTETRAYQSSVMCWPNSEPPLPDFHACITSPQPATHGWLRQAGAEPVPTAVSNR